MDVYYPVIKIFSTDNSLLNKKICHIMISFFPGHKRSKMTYFDSTVQASMRKEVLTDKASDSGDTVLKGTIKSDQAFDHFDANKDGKLDQKEFDDLLADLFRDATGKPHPIDEEKSSELFAMFKDSAEDGITLQAFQKCWDCWIKHILRPISALVVVDVQNDFISGSLAIKSQPAKEDGADLVPIINGLLDTVPFDNIIYSQDWHPTNHISFFDNLNLPGRDFAEDSPIKKEDATLFSNVIFQGPPRTDQTLWPRHCVQGTEGADFHKDLTMHPLGLIVQKGTNPNIDSYSAFFDNGKLAKTELDEKLKEKGVTDVYTCGIATDVCVSFTSNDAQDLGYRTILVDNASGGITPGGISKTKNDIKAKHGIIVNSSEVKDLVQGLNRPFELGYAKALQCKS